MEKNKLGFGCMRLPKKDAQVDYEQFNKMIDYYMEQGFNYFDTAHGYFEQLKDNVDSIKNFKELTDKEYEAIDKVTSILNNLGGIPCTACRYCVQGCPKSISIPDLFACYNSKVQFGDWNSGYYYEIHTKNHGKASDCIKCGKCENICPQHLPIRKYLEEVSKKFE